MWKDSNSNFFKWYKEKKDRKEQVTIMEDYILNSDDFKMDCTPIPIKKKEK